MIDQRVAVLGLGKIGTILLQGLLKAGLPPGKACATVRHAERARASSGQLPVPVGPDNRTAARSADIILISVKPQNVGELLEEIRPEVTPAKLVVSVAASVPTSYIEARLADGVPVGLPRDVATLLSAQTLLGAAKVALDTGDHPALLKDTVTTPAGCTIDGILELEEGKLRVTLIKAVVKSTQRAKELLFET